MRVNYIEYSFLKRGQHHITGLLSCHHDNKSVIIVKIFKNIEENIDKKRKLCAFIYTYISKEFIYNLVL